MTTVRIHRDAAAWSAREEAWWSLLERSRTATPFHTPAWLLPWWRRFGRTDLHVIEVQNGQDTTAMLPLMRSTTDAKCWVAVGTGNSDYLGGLVADSDGRKALFDSLDALVQSGDRVVLSGLRAEDPLIDVAPPSAHCESTIEAQAPQRALESDVTQFRESIARGLRLALRKSEHRLEREGNVTLESAQGENVAPLLEILFRLHARRWETRGEPGGVLDDEAIRAFHLDVARAMDARGMLRLHVLRLDEAPLAAFYGFAWKGTVFAYLGGFDPRFAYFGPGQLMIARAMEFAIERGDTRWDFLRGTEAYKYQWGAADRPVIMRTISALTRAPSPRC